MTTPSHATYLPIDFPDNLLTSLEDTQPQHSVPFTDYTSKAPSKASELLSSDPAFIEVRIIRDPKNKDGWIARQLSSGKVCFISNLTHLVDRLVPGQIWKARTFPLPSHLPPAQIKYYKIDLLRLI